MEKQQIEMFGGLSEIPKDIYKLGVSNSGDDVAAGVQRSDKDKSNKQMKKLAYNFDDKCIAEIIHNAVESEKEAAENGLESSKDDSMTSEAAQDGQGTIANGLKTVTAGLETAEFRPDMVQAGLDIVTNGLNTVEYEQKTFKYGQDVAGCSLKTVDGGLKIIDDALQTDQCGSGAIAGLLEAFIGDSESANSPYLVGEYKSLQSSFKKRSACHICDRTFAYASDLRKHLRIHSGWRPYRCNICDRQFTQSHNLKRHILIHTGEKPYECRLCHQQFTLLSNTKRHIMLKHDMDLAHSDDMESAIASFVEHNTSVKVDLNEFGRKIPDTPPDVTSKGERKKRSYTCFVCNREFSKSSHLKDHMLTHTGEKPYVCNICGKGVTVRSSLKKHLYTHSGERPYICKICGKGYRSASDRSLHMESHDIEKSFSCGLCEVKFATVSTLKRHMLTHTKPKKPYHCDICGKGFKNSKYVKVHKKMHTSSIAQSIAQLIEDPGVASSDPSSAT